MSDKKLKQIEEKLDFLIAMTARPVEVKNAFGDPTMKLIPGEALFNGWKKSVEDQKAKAKENG